MIFDQYYYYPKGVLTNLKMNLVRVCNPVNSIHFESFVVKTIRVDRIVSEHSTNGLFKIIAVFYTNLRNNDVFRNSLIMRASSCIFVLLSSNFEVYLLFL